MGESFMNVNKEEFDRLLERSTTDKELVAGLAELQKGCAVSVFDAADEVYWDEVKKLPKVLQRLSLDDIRTILHDAVFPAIQRVRELDRGVDGIREVKLEDLKKQPNPCGNEECNGINAGIDKCIAPLIKALNDKGMETAASCCGHGNRPGSICLKDGREIMIMSFEDARAIDHLWPDIHSQTLSERLANLERE